MDAEDDLRSMDESDPAFDSDGESDWEEWADDIEGEEVKELKDAEDMGDEAFEPTMGPTSLKFWEAAKGMKKIVIIYHSMFGNLGIMAEEIKKGIRAQKNCEAYIYQVPEVYPESFLQKMNASRAFKDIHPELTRTDIRHFPDADGFLFGMSGRFGSMPAPMKSFFDSTGNLWLKGALIGKPAALFTSSAAQGGGLETLALSAISVLSHHGMMFVPPTAGYPSGKVESQSPFGSNCITGLDGVRAPTPEEKSIASRQGRHFAAVVRSIA